MDEFSDWQFQLWQIKIDQYCSNFVFWKERFMCGPSQDMNCIYLILIQFVLQNQCLIWSWKVSRHQLFHSASNSQILINFAHSISMVLHLTPDQLLKGVPWFQSLINNLDRSELPLRIWLINIAHKSLMSYRVLISIIILVHWNSLFV